MGLLEKIKDKAKRHSERNSSLNFQCVISDSIAYVRKNDWDRIAESSSIFLGRNYLNAIERCSPENTEQKYAIAYFGEKPVVILACQLAEISGEQLLQENSGIREKLAENLKERILVCGNLVSAGLHGVAFDKELDHETAWKITAELLYKIRRSEKLSGQIDFVLIKDIEQDQLESSQIIERFSYRRIQTDPDMVLDLGDSIHSFDDYLLSLTTKYRSRIKKIIKEIEQADFVCEKVTIDEAIDKEMHRLYLEVENKAQTRLATLPVGYFLQLQHSLKDDLSCYAVKNDQAMVGFITVIKDGKDANMYYVGIDYQQNEKTPVYFRLLQLGVQAGIEMSCQRVLMGRTALGPKANLGALPIDTYVWVRHRVPVVNFIIRKLFRNIPFDEAPERKAKK